MKSLLLAALALQLTACATSRPADAPTVLSQPLDAAVQQQADAQRLAASLQQNGKVKVGKGGTLIIQLASPGANLTSSNADNRKQGSRQGNAVSGDGSTGSQASRKAGGISPWWLVGCAVGGALLWGLVKPKWAGWWARVG